MRPLSELIAAMVVLAVLACLRETRPGLAHEAKGQPDFPGRSTALTETAKRFCGFARSRGRHADSGFAVSRELGVNSPFLSSNACAMAGDLLLKNAVDASAVAFWRKRDTLLSINGMPTGSAAASSKRRPRSEPVDLEGDRPCAHPLESWSAERR